jgi:Ser/Thr protein kinase RdoA (MazF antagonist)
MAPDPSTRPAFSEEDARRLARRHYDLDVSVRALPGYSDQNFRLRTEQGDTFVLKIANAAEDLAALAFQQAALAHLAACRLPFRTPRVRPTRTGALLTTATGISGLRHPVWMVTFLPGRTFAETAPHPPALLRSLGRAFGLLDAALEPFTHPAMHRTLTWDLRHYDGLYDRLDDLHPPARRALVEDGLRRFEAGVAPLLPSLRKSIIHNDGNDYNVLVAAGPSGEKTISGLIDFGDTVRTYTAAELAVAATYAMFGRDDLLGAAAHVAAGYHAAYPLTDVELRALFGLITMRLCMSVCMSARAQRQVPDNAYLTVSEAAAWDALERLASVSFAEAEDVFRRACPAPKRTPPPHEDA